MENSRRSVLPAKLTNPVLRGDQQVRNKLLDILEEMSIGWSPCIVQSVGEKFVRVLSATLWYLDPHHGNFFGQGIRIPKMFSSFQNFNDYKAKKTKKPRLTKEGLNEHIQSLSAFLCQPWFARPLFSVLRNGTEELVESMYSYIKYLDRHNEKVQSQHGSPEPIRQPDEFSEVRTILPVSGPVLQEYFELDKALSDHPLYHPLCLNDFFPLDHYSRKSWLTKLTLPYPVKEYRYAHGNQLGVVSFIWRISDPEDESSLAKVLFTVEKQLKVYSTREMRRQFISKYGRLKNSSKAVLRQVYQELMRDSCAARTAAEAEIDNRVAAALLDVNDPDVILDLRKLNGRPKSDVFDDFWNELAIYVQEITPAVDDRRHGEVCHMPIAISIRHLRDMIAERLRKKFPDTHKLAIPSEEWVRLQFWPRNPYSSSALHYTGRFDIKYCVQSRQLRKGHPDTHYVSVLLQYVKAFAVQYQDITQMISVDDKCVVPVGEPGDPISMAVRSHNHSLAHKASKLAALDHDFHVHGIIPSVSFFVNIPDSTKDSFFQGKPYVTLKDKVTQASHALRHSVEVSSIYNVHCDEIKPILILVSDGGADHRLNFLSVQVALICMFSSLDLDFLLCVRTCPYQSWQNLAERVMSTLNLALQNVSLCRKEMSASSEQLIRNKSTLKDIHDVISRNENLCKELRDSISAPMIALSSRIQALTLKDEKFADHIPASDSEIGDFFEHIHFIEPNLDRNHLTKDILKDAPALVKFMDVHCHISQYAFQVKKCKDESCYYCIGKPVRMPVEVFESLHFLPLPRLDSTKQHYRPFIEVWGKEISV